MGYLAIERFSKSQSVPMTRKVAGCVVGETASALLAKPDAFMNLSGGPVAALMKKSRRKPEVVPPAELKDQNPVRVGS